MDYYEYVWGLVKYWIPLMLFIISVTVIRNVLLLVISVTWVAGSILFTMIALPEEDRRIKRYE